MPRTRFSHRARPPRPGKKRETGLYEYLLKTITTGAVVIGGLVTWFEYQNAEHDKAVSRTLEFYKADGAEPIAGYRATIETLWLNENSGMRNALTRRAEQASLLSAPPDGGARPTALWRASTLEAASATTRPPLVDIIVQSGTEYPLQQMFKFYDDLLLCVENGICDYETALGLFGETITSFYNRFTPYVIYFCDRSSNRRFGKRLYYASRIWRYRRDDYDAWPARITFSPGDGLQRTVASTGDNPHCERPPARPADQRQGSG